MNENKEMLVLTGIERNKFASSNLELNLVGGIS